MMMMMMIMVMMKEVTEDEENKWIAQGDTQGAPVVPP